MSKNETTPSKSGEQDTGCCCGAQQKCEAGTEQKQVIRQEYGKIGAGARTGCGCGCGCGDLAVEVSQKAGYTAEELAAAPEGANLGLGCGNPTAIAGLQPGETVLDLGSGGGFDCFLAAKRVGLTGKVIGVDMTAEMIERARENAQHGGYINVEFRMGEIEALPVADASVDVVISNCVLNLVPDKARAFREIARVLKPGGRLMVSDMVLARPLPDWLKASMQGYVACVSGAVERQEYLRYIEATGLTETAILEEHDASDLFMNPTDPLLNQLIIGHPVDDIRGLVASVSIKAVKPR
ncbi:MAG TPA: arsenite methyltransferase [Armatimonadota bacterium]|nr:arsenite methyltransferase [Armatimonadota bacterium]